MRHLRSGQARFTNPASRVAGVLSVAACALVLSAGIARAQNAIVTENALPGNPASEWDVSGAGDPSIQGFATDISVNRGRAISFKVDTDATAYRLDIYRHGLLRRRRRAPGGDAFSRRPPLPQIQPACLSTMPRPGSIDCGNWAVSASWDVPADAPSRASTSRSSCAMTGTPGASHIVFVVRDDAAGSDLLFQTSDTTWQAYNAVRRQQPLRRRPGTDPARAYKVSYNRPFTTARLPSRRRTGLFNAEYPMVRWLERNGYDVSYFDRRRHRSRAAPSCSTHKVFLSVGHDEYWSGGQRANVEAARDAGVNLGVLQRQRGLLEDALGDRASTARRPPTARSSATRRRTPTPRSTRCRTSGPGRGAIRASARPPTATAARERADRARSSWSIGLRRCASKCPRPTASMRFWRNTSVATLAAGADRDARRRARSATSGTRTSTTASRPPGLMRLSTHHVRRRAAPPGLRLDVRPGTATHHLTLYRRPSGALVFGAGTVQWSWGLDDQHDDRRQRRPTPACSRRRSISSRTWARSPRRCRPGWSLAPRRPTRPRRRRRSPRRWTTRSSERHDGDDQRNGGGRRRRRGRRRRGLGRRRHHLASGRRAHDVELSVGAGTARPDGAPRTCGRRQRQHRRCVDRGPGGRRPANVSLHRTARWLDAHDAVVGRSEPRRGGSEVPLRLPRARECDSLLQGRRERRPAYRPPVDRHRNPDRVGDLHGRDRHGMADGHVRPSDPDRRRHDLRRVLSRAVRTLCWDARCLRHRRRGQRPAALPGRPRGRPERRLPVRPGRPLPDGDVPVGLLLGRRGVRGRRGR